MPGQHFLSDSDVRGLKRLAKRVGGGTGVPSRRPVRDRRRNRGGGGGGSGTTAIGTAGEDIPARSGSNPGTGGVDIIKSTGSPSGEWENWSLVEIPDGTYVIAVEIDGDMVITSAFC